MARKRQDVSFSKIQSLKLSKNVAYHLLELIKFLLHEFRDHFLNL